MMNLYDIIKIYISSSNGIKSWKWRYTCCILSWSSLGGQWRVIDTKLFDKRDAFNFSVVRMPFKCSNIPNKMFYSTIGAEVLRICRATSHYNFFLVSARNLITRMRNQDADTYGLQRVLTKMLNRHWKPFEKFNVSLEQIALDISSSA